jgi:hypothetical protein
MNTKALLDLIWDANQDLSFGEAQQVTAVAGETVENEIIKIRRARFGTQKTAEPSKTLSFVESLPQSCGSTKPVKRTLEVIFS